MIVNNLKTKTKNKTKKLHVCAFHGIQTATTLEYPHTHSPPPLPAPNTHTHTGGGGGDRKEKALLKKIRLATWIFKERGKLLYQTSLSVIGVCVLDKGKGIRGCGVRGGGGGEGYNVALAVLPTRSGWSDVKLETVVAVSSAVARVHTACLCRWFV